MNHLPAILVLAPLLGAFFSGLAASQDTGRLAVGAKTGTLGLGG